MKAFALLLLAACTDPLQCPTGTVRAGPTCLVGEPDASEPTGCPTDCSSASASWCDPESKQCSPCQTDPHCAGLPETPVCNPGQGCVACSATNRDACGDFVCDVLTTTCSDKAPASAHDCEPCLADEQCKTGLLCRPMSFADKELGHFCLPVKSGPCPRPYDEAVTTGTSIQGDTRPVCSLRVSTCAAHTHYNNKACGVDNDGKPVPEGMPAAKPDNALCGNVGLEDGFCVLSGVPADGRFRCTVACGNNVNDCPALPGVRCDSSSTPDSCSL